MVASRATEIFALSARDADAAFAGRIKCGLSWRRDQIQTRREPLQDEVADKLKMISGCFNSASSFIPSDSA